MPLQSVVFDMDGTLVDSEKDNIESVVLAMRRLGRELSEGERHFIIGHAWTEIYAMLVENHGVSVPMEKLIAWAVEEKADIIAANGIRPLPGAVSLVRRLAQKVPLAIASGSSKREIDDMVDALDLRACFQALVGAEDCAHGKPDPEPYRLAMEKIGARPAGCVIFEDAPPGIVSAKAAGAAVIGVQVGNYAGFDLSNAHVVIQSLEDVDDALFDRALGLR